MAVKLASAQLFNSLLLLLLPSTASTTTKLTKL